MKPLNFRNLVENIMSREYERIELKPVNKVVIDNLAWFTWDISDNVEDMCKILKDDMYEIYDGKILEKFDFEGVCKKVSNVTLIATHCSV